VYVDFTVQAPNQPTQYLKKALGNLNNGDHNVDIAFEIDSYPGMNVAMMYQIVNSRNSDPSQKLYQFAMGMVKKSIDGGVKAGSEAIGGSSWWGKIIEVAASGFPDLTSIILLAPLKCDGYVAGEPGLVFTESHLKEITGSANLYRVTVPYSGIDSPFDCGRNSQYSVTWSITHITQTAEQVRKRTGR
jgi:hypothetical protein